MEINKKTNAVLCAGGRIHVMGTEKGFITFLGLGWEAKREVSVTEIEILKESFKVLKCQNILLFWSLPPPKCQNIPANIVLYHFSI